MCGFLHAAMPLFAKVLTGRPGSAPQSGCPQSDCTMPVGRTFQGMLPAESSLLHHLFTVRFQVGLAPWAAPNGTARPAAPVLRGRIGSHRIRLDNRRARPRPGRGVGRVSECDRGHGQPDLGHDLAPVGPELRPPWRRHIAGSHHTGRGRRPDPAGFEWWGQYRDRNRNELSRCQAVAVLIPPENPLSPPVPAARLLLPPLASAGRIVVWRQHG